VAGYVKTTKPGIEECALRGEQVNSAATISRDGKQVSLGRFNSSEEAAQVYDAAAINFYGPLARLNFTGARSGLSRQNFLPCSDAV
jgi:hypothetical protein